MTDRRDRFEAEVLPHLDAAYNLARWLTGSVADADDVVQEACLRAYRAFDALRGDGARAWLLAIVRNCALTAIGRRSRVVLEPDPGAREDAEAGRAAPEGPLDALIREEQSAEIDGVIASLEADFREVLVLREIEDLSYREIAAVIGAPVGTVMSRLARARAALRASWHGRAGGSNDGMR